MTHAISPDTALSWRKKLRDAVDDLHILGRAGVDVGYPENLIWDVITEIDESLPEPEGL